MAAPHLFLEASKVPCANDEKPRIGRERGDERIARATNAMLTRIDARWTVRSLAKIAGMSRAAFARLFWKEHGAPPLKWLTAQRMRRASDLFADGDGTLSNIAKVVGYESEFALSRAFKRHFGVAPAVYRSQLRVGRAEPTMALAA
ncbi:MAG: helix-turn-helix transcriptional regulator [Polyangiaceae bacterium]|nr:helix-turn-helix transcriptional regulator [Polyangiaceae bacterium]